MKMAVAAAGLRGVWDVEAVVEAAVGGVVVGGAVPQGDETRCCSLLQLVWPASLHRTRRGRRPERDECEK